MCSQDKARFECEATGGRPQPLLLCNMHGGDIIKHYQVHTNGHILSPDCEHFAPRFELGRWNQEQKLYQSVSTEGAG
jgi:hypothetical protein